MSFTRDVGCNRVNYPPVDNHTSFHLYYIQQDSLATMEQTKVTGLPCNLGNRPWRVHSPHIDYLHRTTTPTPLLLTIFPIEFPGLPLPHPPLLPFPLSLSYSKILLSFSSLSPSSPKTLLLFLMLPLTFTESLRLAGPPTCWRHTDWRLNLRDKTCFLMIIIMIMIICIHKTRHYEPWLTISNKVLI